MHSTGGERTIRAPIHGSVLDRSRKDYMPTVRVKENEPFEVALRRFKRSCEKAGVVTDARKREFFEKPSQERKRKKVAAVKRAAKRLSRDVTRRRRMY